MRREGRSRPSCAYQSGQGKWRFVIVPGEYVGRSLRIGRVWGHV
jgi:hypothetical protein